MGLDMSNLTQFLGSGVKSIQRGVITLINTDGSETATLSPAVDTAKSELRLLGVDGASTVGGPKIVLTNTTTVTASRSNTSGEVLVSWELTEYY
jgi:hypothetical protein